MGKLLWTPSEKTKTQANMTRFIGFVNKRNGLSLKSYDDLYLWSVQNISDFWAAVWEFIPIKSSRKYSRVVDDISKFPGAKWFEGARINFAENLLRYRDDRTAIIFKGETQPSRRITYRDLYYTVGRLANALRRSGIKPGDRVAAYMPNLPETAIAMLATTSVGAVWASCATDLGAQAAMDRLGQVAPKILFTVDGYFYKGKPFDSLANAEQIAKGIPSLEKVIVTSYKGDTADINRIPNAQPFAALLDKNTKPDIVFEQLPFDHPVFIMFSSGTTGKPKCMVQGAGGVLINHLKELIIHADLKRDDVVLYMTTCSWMMWNWLISSLGVGATLILYEGASNYPDTSVMWKLVEDEKISVFGTSASYINALKSEGFVPNNGHDVSSIREICQTGSPLSVEGFQWAYEAIKKDVHFNSISGGTDINGCFAIGNPTLPVYAGELQRWGLGMKMNCYNERGKPVVDQTGELVCEAPEPSMPLYFWNDPNGERYREAYFTVFPNVWRHGDYVKVHSDTKGVTFLGRSDAMLKPSGVRIGTAEIYNQLDKIPDLADSLAIGQQWKGDQRIILFVKLAKGYELTDELKNRLCKTLREKASPRHVPAKIIAVPDIPYTLNMKKVEIAVTNIIHGRPVLNRDALANPESLDFYEKIKDTQLQS